MAKSWAKQATERSNRIRPCPLQAEGFYRRVNKISSRGRCARRETADVGDTLHGMPEKPEIGVILLDGSIHDEVIDTQFHVPGVGLGIDSGRCFPDER